MYTEPWDYQLIRESECKGIFFIGTSAKSAGTHESTYTREKSTSIREGTLAHAKRVDMEIKKRLEHVRKERPNSYMIFLYQGEDMIFRNF